MCNRLKQLFSGMWRNLGPRLAWLAFGAALFLGCWGFWRLNGDLGLSNSARLSDALYRTLQLFGAEFGLPANADGTEAEANLQLHLARLIAIAAASYAILAVFFTSTLDSIRRWFQVSFRHRNRHVLLGFGEINRAVATVLAGQHGRTPVTAVDRSFDAVDRRLARDLGILLLEGSLSDPHTLRRARVDRAKRVIVSTGDDIRSIEVANAVAPTVEEGLKRDFGPKLTLRDRLLGRAVPQTEPAERPKGQDPQGQHRLRVHLGDLRLCQDLPESRDMALDAQDCFRPFNIKQDAARDFVLSARLLQRAQDHGRKRVHLVIAGMGTQGEAILIEALQTSYGMGMFPPKITILDKDADIVEARLRAHYPFLMDNRLVPQGDHDPTEGFEPITVIPLDISRTSFNTSDILNRLDESGHPPSAWVFCCGNDQVNLTAAIQLEIAMQSRARRPVPIHVRSWNLGPSSDAPRRQPVFGFIQHFGEAGATIKSSDLLREDGDEMAKAIHRAYQALSEADEKKYERDEKLKNVVPVDVGYRADWLHLPEPVRNANRRAARSIPFKLTEVGFAWPRPIDAELPMLNPKVVDRLLERLGTFCTKCDGQEEQLKRYWDIGASELGAFFDSYFFDRNLRRVALAEHSAWVIERSSSGWYQLHPPHETRDNSLRRQGNIKPFGEIHPDIQKYDLVALETALKTKRSPNMIGSLSSRVVCEFDIADGFPSLEQLAGSTDIHLRVTSQSASGLNDTGWFEATDKFRATLSTWSETSRASRIQILLEFPVYMPTVSLNSDERASATNPVIYLTDALNDLSETVYCDVTRTYRRVDIPPSGFVSQKVVS